MFRNISFIGKDAKSDISREKQGERFDSVDARVEHTNIV